MNFNKNDTIVALATAHGSAAIAVIRLSGPQCINIIEKSFFTKSLQPKSLSKLASHRLSFGVIMHQNIVVDEVLVSIFRAPHSYTGQDCIEVACHGSQYIQQQLLQLFLSDGARMAEPGEFTMRAFLNGRMDLSQAEAVADLIASNSPISHQVAMQQMRGGFSKKINELRIQLVNFASLIELELDFSEEDVEFADRKDLQSLVHNILNTLQNLIQSFEVGNVLKNGIPVAIIGRPNAGKSTLLNVLLNDERAIVSEIPGTTRDTIEDETIINGILFRFIDTAGIRATTDVIEQIGVSRAMAAIKKSSVVIYLFDVNELSSADLHAELSKLTSEGAKNNVIAVANKIDLESLEQLKAEYSDFPETIFISAKEQTNIQDLKNRLLRLFENQSIDQADTIVTNARHAQALKNAATALEKVQAGLTNNTAGDFLALDIRFALQELGNITGSVTNEDLLTNIFTKFCIGK